MLVVSVLAFGALSATAAARTRFVASAGSDEVGNECLSPTNPCQTVQWGIAEAEAGDTISIGAGTYEGLFRVDKELTLVGEGPSTLLEGEPTVQRPVFLTSDVTLENLRVRGGLSGTSAMNAIYIAGGAGTHVSLDHVVAEQAPGATEGRNVVYAGGGDVTITNSTITGVGSSALFVVSSASVIESNISVTPVNRGGDAVTVYEGGTADLKRSIIDDPGYKGDALFSGGGTITAADSAFTGRTAIWASRGSATLTRDRLAASEVGLLQQNGATVEVRDSLISPVVGGKLPDDVEVNPSATPAALTIVGSTLYAEGSGNSIRGARAVEVGQQEGEVRTRVANSILRAVEPAAPGLAFDIVDGARGATTWSVTYSAFTTKGGEGIPAPGTGTNVSVAPIFAGQAVGDYRLTEADSVLIDAGDPAQVSPEETDLANRPRALGGTCSGVAAPDIGAYELVRTKACPVGPSGIGQTTQGTASSPENKNVRTPSKPRITGAKVKQGPRGPILEFTLSEPAKVTVAITKAVTHGTGAHRTTRYQRVATITASAGKGTKAIPLSTRLRSVGSAQGSYRLNLVAAADGLKSATRAVSFVQRTAW